MCPVITGNAQRDTGRLAEGPIWPGRTLAAMPEPVLISERQALDVLLGHEVARAGGRFIRLRRKLRPLRELIRSDGSVGPWRCIVVYEDARGDLVERECRLGPEFEWVGESWASKRRR
jgi:hypothetical protein